MEGTEEGGKYGAVDKWLSGGLMQHGEVKNIKHLFTEGNVLTGDVGTTKRSLAFL